MTTFHSEGAGHSPAPVPHASSEQKEAPDRWVGSHENPPHQGRCTLFYRPVLPLPRHSLNLAARTVRTRREDTRSDGGAWARQLRP